MSAYKHMLKSIILALSLTISATPLTAEPAKVVLIIDDIGNNQQLGQRALALPGDVNYAILPFSLYGRRLARQADDQNKEVLLHAPMSNVRNRPLGRGALTEEMTQLEFNETLARQLAAVPNAKGINNHMGSLLTQMPKQMSWLMNELKERELYFIDSRTTANTVAETVAIAQHLPHLRRHVFLDNQRQRDAIRQQFEKLLHTAKREGIAVGIGHPYPETLAFLEQALPALALRDIQLIHASTAINAIYQDSCQLKELLAKTCDTSLQLAHIATN